MTASIDQTSESGNATRSFTLSPCGRGCTRYEVAWAGEGSFSADATPHPARTSSVPPSPTRGEGKKRMSMRLAEGQVDALTAQQMMFAVGERRDAVKEQPRRAAPYHDIAM